MASNNGRISKGWLLVNLILTFVTGGLWLIPLGIWWGAKMLKNR